MMETEILDKFIQDCGDGKRVIIQGLGFVGAVTAVVCASAGKGYNVIGVDQDSESGREKVKGFRTGKLPIDCEDEELYRLYRLSIAEGGLTATWDPSAYALGDVIIVNVNLDVQKEFVKDRLEYDVDIEPFSDAIRVIGSQCKEDALVIIETTVPPGTVKEVVTPIIREELRKRGLDSNRIKIGHSYERVMPGKDYIGSVINNYRVYSGVDLCSSKATEEFLSTIINTEDFPLTELKSTCASEMAKVLENSYRAMNIGFMVEWSRFAEEAGVNLYEVVNAIRMRPTHKNIMYPGIGVGGYCLPKDPLLASWSRKKFYNQKEGLKQSEEAVRITRKMPSHAISFIEKHFEGTVRNKNVLILGLSYNKNVGDTRDTPASPVIDYFLNNGNVVQIHDPYIEEWEQESVCMNLKNIYAVQYDLIILCTAHDEYSEDQGMRQVFKETKKDLLVVDTVGVLSENMIKQLNNDAKVKVVGRGDI